VSEPVLALSEVFKSYGRTTVLQGVTLTVNSGDFYVVTGPPSSGKSVLLRAILGLDRIDGGSVMLNGKDVTDTGPQGRGIGYVPQSFALFPNKSVRDNITYPMRLDKVDKVTMAETLERVSDLLGISDLLDKRPDQLSGGQKQRVAIARGLAKQTDFFVLDDPLVGLDFKLRERLIDDLKRTRSALGVTFLYSTSDALESLLLASRVGILADGQIVDEGDLERVYDDPRQSAAMRSLGFPEANIVDATMSGSTASCVLGDFPVSIEGSPGSVLLGIRPEHIRIGSSGAGAVSSTATVLFTEDIGGSEIVYLRVDDTPISTVLGADAPELEQLKQGQVTISVMPQSVLVFDQDTHTRIGQGASRG
jgi:ABC-type sugar transport system ATPase subunit